MEERKSLLKVKDLEVKFRVRDRILTAIRGISLDIYDNESIAIVGESGSGKSVFTKTFAGMLDDNGFISNGAIIFRDEELSNTVVKKDKIYSKIFAPYIKSRLDKYSKLSLSGKEYKEFIHNIEIENEQKILSNEDKEIFDKKLNDLLYERTELFNLKQTYDPKSQKVEISETISKIKTLDIEIKEVKKEIKIAVAEHKKAYNANKEHIEAFNKKQKELKEIINSKRLGEVSKETLEHNELLTKEIYLSVGRYKLIKRIQLTVKLLKLFKEAYKLGEDLSDNAVKNPIFDKVAFRVKYLDETEEILHGKCVVNLAKVNYANDWQQIRGKKIATIFQDPMTSLNPILTIGQQISSIIIKHQHVSEVEARRKAVELMMKVGIPNAEDRFDDYPFQYSGGMRQRIVIAIALSCQPKILICDEPTTALDVTIQAQILKLIKDLQKEFGYTIVFITHDLGVVANIADRVAVLYAGQIVEVGTVKDVFYDPRHPYTWALLSSLPQLAKKGETLFSITGTPPSLYNKIKGDPFAPRNPYCLKIDKLMDSPMFQISETHYAKTWLLDPRAPKISKPKGIEDIHGVLMKAFNVSEVK